MYDPIKRIPGGLANNICEERKKSVGPLAVIEENVPPSREYDGAYEDLNPRSAEANLQKSKAKNLHQNIEKVAIVHETRTPHYLQNQKDKAKDLINY
jgi:hypothetical protein